VVTQFERNVENRLVRVSLRLGGTINNGSPASGGPRLRVVEAAGNISHPHVANAPAVGFDGPSANRRGGDPN
jgi:hypothetical protein